MDSLSERLKNMTPLQRAVFALKETQARLAALEQKRAEPIAIVGMACRFPGGANDPVSFWRLLCDGVDAIGEIPADRWDVEAFYDADPTAPGKMNTRWGGFLERIDEFDNHFFGISESEATRIDPQQRLLLELAWEALEDAGLRPSKLRGTNIGVFIGISVSEYGLMLSSDLSQTHAHAAAGTSLCLAANRLSFTLGLQGPSVALDTACSSSLVALHLACQSIRNGECEGALVGGANLLLSPIGTVNLTKSGFSAADGRVRAFDAAATGYVRSEGVGLVMLKPLSEALKNNDPIYAVIRGSAVNQNGSGNGLTAPSRVAQEQMLRDAYAKAQVSPGLVQFVETQGTGTRLGDTIEALALGNVLRTDRPANNYCAIGALKTNIGHLETASGIASLMKAALALKHRQLPPNLHFRSPNPDIPLDTLPLRMQTRLEPWPDAQHPRYAGVSALGFGGSNAHAVLEEPPTATADLAMVQQPSPQLLPLSARTEKAMHQLASRYRQFLTNENLPAWSDICHTAGCRRDHHDCRVAVLADSSQQASEFLSDYLAGKTEPRVFSGRKPFGRGLKIAFLFSDRLENWKSMVPQLLADADFASAVKEIDVLNQRITGCSLHGLLADDIRWNDPRFAKCALVVLQLALAAWWRSRGIKPDIVLGHGWGELAAATTAGIFTAEEILRLLANTIRSNGAAISNPPQTHPAELPFLSTIDGKAHSKLTVDVACGQSSHGRECDMTAVAAALAERNVDICLETGPAELSQLIASEFQKSNSPCVAVASLVPTTDCNISLLTAAGILYAAGAELQWENLAAGCHCVRAPTYPWQRQRFWAPNKKWLASPAGGSSTKDEPSPSESQAAAPGKATEIRSRPGLTAPYVEPRTKLEADLTEAWTSILRIQGIGIHDNFFELGGDSLQAVILLNRLQEHLGRAVPGHVLFQVQTIHDLADYLRINCPDAVGRKYPTDVDAPAAEQLSAADPQFNVVAKQAVSIPRVARDQQAEELLARLDELEDDEVELLLSQNQADGEVTYE